MDNAVIHKAKSINDVLAHINAWYNSPYSPFLNPLEEIWGMWKGMVRQKIRKSETLLCDEIINRSNSVTKGHIKAFFRHSIEFYPKCLAELNV